MPTNEVKLVRQDGVIKVWENGEFVPLDVGGSVDLTGILAELDENDLRLMGVEARLATLEAGGGGGAIEEWIDVSRYFHLEYRSSPGVEVQRGPGGILSVGYFRTARTFWVDAYIRFGDGRTTYKQSLSSGEIVNGWDLVCYDSSLYPLGATGGFGICQIHSADPHEGDNTTGKANWEPKPDGKWAIVPRSTPLGVSAGNFSWSYPEVSGHSVWEFEGSYFRIMMGPCRRRV
jgi:hypothetical protein